MSKVIAIANRTAAEKRYPLSERAEAKNMSGRLPPCAHFCRTDIFMKVRLLEWKEKLTVSYASVAVNGMLMSV